MFLYLSGNRLPSSNILFFQAIMWQFQHKSSLRIMLFPKQRDNAFALSRDSTLFLRLFTFLVNLLQAAHLWFIKLFDEFANEVRLLDDDGCGRAFRPWPTANTGISTSGIVNTFFCLPWRHNIFYSGTLPGKSRCPPLPRRGALNMQTVQSKELHSCVHWELHNLPHWSAAMLCLHWSKFAGWTVGDWRFLTHLNVFENRKTW